jgi:hypothetical protein
VAAAGVLVGNGDLWSADRELGLGTVGRERSVLEHSTSRLCHHA